MMKTTVTLLALAAATCLGVTAPAASQEMKPLLVVSFAGLDELLLDLDFVGETSDIPELGASLDAMMTMFTQGQGIGGLDKTKPWGASVMSDGVEFQPLGFLPVNDLEAFLESLSALFGEPEDQGDGVFLVELKGVPLLQTLELYFKQSGDWTYASIGKEFLADLPENPLELLGGLDKKYDLAARININNIPENIRMLGVMQLQSLLSNVPAMPDETEEQFERRKKLLSQQFDTLTSALSDVEQIMIGGVIDREARRISVDLELTAVPDSPTAKALASLGTLTSRFSGFMLPDAAAAATINLKISDTDIDQMLAGFPEMAQQALAMLTDLYDVPEGELRAILDDLNAGLFAAGEGTIRAGRVDMGVALLGEGPFTLVAGASVPDADKLAEQFNQTVSRLEDEVGFFGARKNVEEHDGVTFHIVSVPLPEGDAAKTVGQLFGADADLEVTVGFAADRAYVALGPDGLAKLKMVIDRSKSMTEEVTPPLRLNAKLAPILKRLAAEENADPNISMMAVNVESGKDGVKIIADKIENGVKIRFEGQEGVVAVLGSLISTLGSNFGGGAF